jgi:hypothetical protein
MRVRAAADASQSLRMLDSARVLSGALLLERPAEQDELPA